MSQEAMGQADGTLPALAFLEGRKPGTVPVAATPAYSRVTYRFPLSMTLRSFCVVH